VQLALPDLLESAESTRRAILARVSENRALLEATLRGSAATVLRAEGGWYSVVRLPRTLSEEEWVLGLLDQGVWVQPGYFYDFEEEAFTVVSLLTPEADFLEGVATLEKFVASRV
jgi:DNA-binding transcriptional MocR family regulator